MRELGELGVRRVSIGSGFSRAALTAFVQAAREVREHETFQFADDTLYMSEPRTCSINHLAPAVRQTLAVRSQEGCTFLSIPR